MYHEQIGFKKYIIKYNRYIICSTLTIMMLAPLTLHAFCFGRHYLMHEMKESKESVLIGSLDIDEYQKEYEEKYTISLTSDDDFAQIEQDHFVSGGLALEGCIQFLRSHDLAIKYFIHQERSPCHQKQEIKSSIYFLWLDQVKYLNPYQITSISPTDESSESKFMPGKRMPVKPFVFSEKLSDYFSESLPFFITLPFPCYSFRVDSNGGLFFSYNTPVLKVYKIDFINDEEVIVSTLDNNIQGTITYKVNSNLLTRIEIQSGAFSLCLTLTNELNNELTNVRDLTHQGLTQWRNPPSGDTPDIELESYTRKMACSVKPKRKKTIRLHPGQYRKYRPCDLEETIALTYNGIHYKEAAKKTGVPPGTIYDRTRGNPTPRTKLEHKRVSSKSRNKLAHKSKEKTLAGNQLIKKGAWDKDEIDRFNQALLKFESTSSNWNFLQKAVLTRNKKQCQHYYATHFSSDGKEFDKISKENWQDDENERFMKYVNLHGTAWSLIQRKYFPNFSANDLKNKWYSQYRQ